MNAKSNGYVRARLYGIALAALAAFGCSATDDSAGKTEDAVSTRPPANGPSAGTPARKYGGRAITATARVNTDLLKKAGDILNGSCDLGSLFGGAPVDDYNEQVFVSDTKPLPDKGGTQVASLVTFNGGNLFTFGKLNASTKGEGNKVDSRADLDSTSIFNGPGDGLLKDVVTHGGTIHVDLSELLKGIDMPALDGILGKGGPLDGGIQADVVEEDAMASCDAGAQAHAKADVKLARLVIGGREYKIGTAPNQLVFWDPPKVRVYANVQKVQESGASARVDAAALHILILEGAIDVKIGRAMAAVQCTDAPAPAPAPAPVAPPPPSGPSGT